mgnify:CR=1 FL=1
MSPNVSPPHVSESWLGETDIWLLAQGQHLRPWEKLGAHPCTQGTQAGTVFAVWAPNARRVSVVGDFNHWDAQQHVMQRHAYYGAWALNTSAPELPVAASAARIAGSEAF